MFSKFYCVYVIQANLEKSVSSLSSSLYLKKILKVVENVIDHAISDLLNALKASSFSWTFLYNSVAFSQTSVAEGISVPLWWTKMFWEEW